VSVPDACAQKQDFTHAHLRGRGTYAAAWLISLHGRSTTAHSQPPSCQLTLWLQAYHLNLLPGELLNHGGFRTASPKEWNLLAMQEHRYVL
jgi:hypothetical protein